MWNFLSYPIYRCMDFTITSFLKPQLKPVTLFEEIVCYDFERNYADILFKLITTGVARIFQQGRGQFPHFFFYSDQRGWGHGPLCPLIYASDSGVARICQRGGGQSDGAKRPSAGGGCGRGCPPPPTVGRFLKFRVSE